jgi:alcohol dehydrogenase class IV
MDCFTQLTEAYLSDKAGAITDALALDGLKAVNRSLLRSYTNGDDIKARSDMSYAALMSGICLANAGLGAVHGMAGTTGALFNIPHGAVCGTLMAAANDMNVRELMKIIRHGSSTGGIAVTNANSALGKYSALGRIFTDATGKSDNYYIGFFIDYLHAISYRLNMPKLSSYGLVHDDLEAISSQSDVKNNPVRLSSAQLLEILVQRL